VIDFEPRKMGGKPPGM